MKRLFVIIFILSLVSSSFAEIHLKKNKAAELMLPMIDKATPESFKAGETVTDSCYYRDGVGAWTSLPIVGTVAEIGNSGIYKINLTATEMNHDYILCKFTATNSADTAITIKTYTKDIEDAVTVSPTQITTGILDPFVTVTSAPITIRRGDEKRLIFNLGPNWNLTGKKAYFSMKTKPTLDNAQAKVNRTITITDAVNGIGEITLTTSETDTVAVYYGEVEVRNTDESSPLTAWEGRINIVRDVRQ